MRPHLALLDCLHHFRAEDAEFKVRVLESKGSANQGRHRKDGECHLYKAQVAPDNLRVGHGEKTKNRCWTRLTRGINDIVSARQKLIQVTGEMNRTTVFAQRSQIGGNLPVQQ